MVISAATVSLYSAGYSSNALGNSNLVIVVSTQSNANNLVVGDFSSVGNVSFGSISYASWSNSGYNAIALNASGISAITKAGITKFASILEWDRAGSFSGSWLSRGTSFYSILQADNGSNAPKLVVTYTAATAYTQSLSASMATMSGLIPKTASKFLSGS